MFLSGEAILLEELLLRPICLVLTEGLPVSGDLILEEVLEVLFKDVLYSIWRCNFS